MVIEAYKLWNLSSNNWVSRMYPIKKTIIKNIHFFLNINNFIYLCNRTTEPDCSIVMKKKTFMTMSLAAYAVLSKAELYHDNALRWLCVDN